MEAGINRGWRILLVEDDEDDFILTRATLAKSLGDNFKLHWASTIQSALKIIKKEQLDVLLVDYDLGAYTGLEVIRAAANEGCRVPSILLTGRGSYDIDVEAMRAGAVDHLAKGEVSPPLLERAIRYAVQHQKSQEALRQANERLEVTNTLLAQAKDQLEQRVEERTRELQAEVQERKRTQEALQEKDARLQLFLTQLPAIVWSTDIELTFTSVAGRGLPDSDIDLNALLTQNLRAMLPPDPNRYLVIDAHERALRGEPVSFDLATGERFFRCHLKPFYNPNDDLIGVIGIALDVTESKRIESELAEVQRRLIDNTEAERLQLSQELHDGPMQDLYGLAFQMDSLKPGLQPEEQARLVGIWRDKMMLVIQTLRELSGELRPPTLTPFGLEKAIRSHIEQFRHIQPDLQIHLDLARDGRQLPERVRLALFRIYQMAMTNVVRHAEASEVSVRLSLEPDYAELEIQDNGRGFQAPSRWVELVRKGHFGLAGAAERAEAIGGRLEVRSAPGEGARLRVVVPRGRENGQV
jgi:signal transduction histidine kinase/FixJ family two-component response regulator